MSCWLLWEKLQPNLSFTILWYEMSTEVFLQIVPVRFYEWMQERSVSFSYLYNITYSLRQTGGLHVWWMSPGRLKFNKIFPHMHLILSMYEIKTWCKKKNKIKTQQKINLQTFLQNSVDKISCVIFIIHLKYRYYITMITYLR